MLHADPRGFLVLLAVAMFGAMAAVLHRASIPGGIARRLSLPLVFEGITWGRAAR